MQNIVLHSGLVLCSLQPLLQTFTPTYLNSLRNKPYWFVVSLYLLIFSYILYVLVLLHVYSGNLCIPSYSIYPTNICLVFSFTWSLPLRAIRGPGHKLWLKSIPEVPSLIQHQTTDLRETHTYPHLTVSKKPTHLTPFAKMPKNLSHQAQNPSIAYSLWVTLWCLMHTRDPL